MLREQLFNSEHFVVRRISGEASFSVGGGSVPTVLVNIDGSGTIESAGVEYVLEKGGVMLLPAILGVCDYTPLGKSTLLEIALPATS